ncbi:Uncharacterized protein QTN25_004151 [Entamoeba marina]
MKLKNELNKEIQILEKTSFIKQLIDHEFPSEKPVNPPRNHFDDFEFPMGGKQYRIQIGEFVDTNSEISGYGLEFKGAHIVIGLVNLGSVETLNNIKNWIGLRNRLSTDNVPFIKVICGNVMQDTPEVSENAIETVAENIGALYKKVNVKTGEGFTDMFQTAIRELTKLEPSLCNTATIGGKKTKNKSKDKKDCIVN